MTKKKRSISIVFILLMLCRLTTFSQTVIDSLLVELNKVGTTEDSIRIYLSLSETEEDGPMSLNYAYQALDNLNEIDNSELFVTAYQSIGHALEKVNLLDSAKLFYKKALTLADSIQNTSKSALIHLDLGDLENTRGNNAAALRHFTTANNYFDTPSHLDSAWFSLNRLGIVYNEMGLYAKSLEYYLKAYQLIQDSDDNNAKLILLNNLGIIYNEIGKPEDSKEYYNRGLEIAKAYGVSDKEAVLLSNLSIVYKEQRDTLGALDLIRKSHAIQVENNFTCGLAYSYEGLGEIMTWKREYDSHGIFSNKR
ncbi:tetratricopeptide repeat protein [Reichenbachiella sp.]|uniref:tetratricopeptide repeat protein n=1 Tax=Reichenbachiella sp. TaxID=2184521 RepID=UPI003BB079AB